jgi:hypothetical protein
MGRNPVGSRHVHRDDCTLLANPQVRGRHRKLPCEVAGVQATSHRQGGRKASTPRTLGGCRSTHVPRRRPLPRSPRFPPGRAPSGRRPRGWRVAVRGTGAYGRPSCARCMRVTSRVCAGKTGIDAEIVAHRGGLWIYPATTTNGPIGPPAYTSVSLVSRWSVRKLAGRAPSLLKLACRGRVRLGRAGGLGRFPWTGRDGCVLRIHE